MPPGEIRDREIRIRAETQLRFGPDDPPARAPAPPAKRRRNRLIQNRCCTRVPRRGPRHRREFAVDDLHDDVLRRIAVCRHDLPREIGKLRIDHMRRIGRHSQNLSRARDDVPAPEHRSGTGPLKQVSGRTWSLFPAARRLRRVDGGAFCPRRGVATLRRVRTDELPRVVVRRARGADGSLPRASRSIPRIEPIPQPIPCEVESKHRPGDG